MLASGSEPDIGRGFEMTDAENISFAIVTCSDTRGIDQDAAGDFLEKAIVECGWVCRDHSIVKDEIDQIADAIVRASDKLGCDIVLTCGGTGLSPRDVTPEATRKVCDREVPGIAEGMRVHSLKYTSRAMLSRALCMQRGSTLVVNLPGSTKAATENWEAIVDVLPHAVSMMAAGGHE